MNRLRELREKRQLSMKETAKRLKMPYTTYVNYEKETREPNSETLVTLARFFDVTVDYLIGNVNDPLFYLDNKRILAEINSWGDEKIPLTIYDEGEKEIISIFDELNSNNRSKLLELSRLYLDHQRKNEETK